MVYCRLQWHPEYKSLLITSLTHFLCAFEYSILLVGEWPYLRQIDKEATSSFYGFASALAEGGHSIGALLFAFMAHRMGNIRPALLMGRLLTLIGCLLYLSVELFPCNRRYVQLTVYMLFAIGFSTSPLLRALVSSQSSLPNRATAYAFLHTAQVLSFLFGAVLQLGFSGLQYPGVEILPNIKIHVYTVSIWLALVTNILAILVILFKLKAQHREVEKISYSFEWLRSELTNIRKMNLKWSLIGVVILEKSLVGSVILFMAVTNGPIMTAIYGLTGQETVRIIATMKICQGSIATLLSLGFVIANLGKRISTRSIFICSTILVVCAAIASFLYPNSQSLIAQFNETARTGCDPAEYTWCFDSSATPFLLYVIPAVAIIGIAVPSAFLSVDTIYSRLLGDIDQSFMQAVLMVFDDISDAIFRIAAAAAFTSFGYSSISIVLGTIFVSATAIWMAVWSRIKPYS